MACYRDGQTPEGSLLARQSASQVGMYRFLEQQIPDLAQFPSSEVVLKGFIPFPVSIFLWA